MNIHYRPIDKWPGEPTKVRQASPFSARWDDTLDLLDRELHQLRARSVVFQIALREEGFRKTDGQPKTNAPPSHPGVILAFESKYGPLKYACDRFTDFQSNVRAIALGLEALRKVDRYGITKRGEQYTGWKALPGAGGSVTTMTAEAAAEFVSRACGGACSARALLQSVVNVAPAYREAARRLHPDAGGSTEDFQRLQEAKRVLDAHHGGR